MAHFIIFDFCKICVEKVLRQQQSYVIWLEEKLTVSHEAYMQLLDSV